MLEGKRQGTLLYRWSNILMNYLHQWVSLVAQSVKNLPAMQDTWLHSLGWEDPLEKGITTHSRFHAWRIPRTEEPGRLQSMRSESYTTERLTRIPQWDSQPLFLYLQGWPHPSKTFLDPMLVL